MQNSGPHPRLRHHKPCVLGAAVLAVALPLASAEKLLPKNAYSFNVLVITLDTIRTDRLGAYGNPDAHTDFVDGLAARGVIFDRCISPTPLTLPSHTSFFTGTHPVFHGVRDNGNYVVAPELITMAELFSDAGYRTGGFVGAFVLSSRWGLDQGFDTYSEPVKGYDPTRVSLSQIERRADEVVDDAIEWLKEDSKRPFFAWVHLYDPHLPYDPPSDFARRFPQDPYLGEVAFADAQLGRLQAWLRTSGLDARTMIVFAGDHGEGLGDHGEFDHGLLLYQTTVRAPLIIAYPGMTSAGTRRPEAVSLVDVLPTLAEAIGLPLPENVQGQSLWPLVSGHGQYDERPVYAETHYPKLHFGWSPLTAIYDRQFQLIHSSEPELYDLDTDPGQEHDLFESRADVADRLARQLQTMVERLEKGSLDAAKAPDAETIAKLAALGYVVSGADVAEGQSIDDLPSPRSMLWLYNRFVEANAAVWAGDAVTAEKKLLEILAADDSLVDAWVELSGLYRRQGRMVESLSAVREAYARRPLDPFLVSKLADALISTRQPAEAEKLLLAAMEKHPENPSIVFSLARIMETSGRFAEAERLFAEALKLDPLSAPTHFRLGTLALRRGDLTEAEAQLDAALSLDPHVPGASFLRGQILEARGRLEDAAQAYREELSAAPESLAVTLALSRLEGRLGRPIEQEQVLRDAIQANPHSPSPYLVLAFTFLQRQERYEEAIELVELALQQRPKGQELRTAYALLTDLYYQIGDLERAAEYARLAEQSRAGENDRR